jgi:malate/lactate dehydrogenase
VLAWSQASGAGSNAAAALPAHAILRLGDQVRASWPPGPHALGSAGARVVRVMTSGLPRRATVFAVVEQPGDVRRVAAAAPAYLNEQGIVRVQWPAMSERERVELDTVLAGLLQTS